MGHCSMIHRTSILELLKWMAKSMVGMRHLPTELQVGANAILESLSWS